MSYEKLRTQNYRVTTLSFRNKYDYNYGSSIREYDTSSQIDLKDRSKRRFERGLVFHGGATGCWSIRSKSSFPIPNPSILAISAVFNLGFGMSFCFNHEYTIKTFFITNNSRASGLNTIPILILICNQKDPKNKSMYKFSIPLPHSLTWTFSNIFVTFHHYH